MTTDRKLPKWIDDMKGSDPTMDKVIVWIEQNLAAPPMTVSEDTAAKVRAELAKIPQADRINMIQGAEQPVTVEPHKYLTREEYNASNIPGWHLVLHNADSGGSTAIRMAAEAMTVEPVVLGYLYGTALLHPDDAPVGEPDCEALGRIIPAEPRRAMTPEERRELAGNYFAEEWAIRYALKMLEDFAAHHAIPASPDATDTGSQE